jgi:hypothetical protein
MGLPRYREQTPSLVVLLNSSHPPRAKYNGDQRQPDGGYHPRIKAGIR